MPGLSAGTGQSEEATVIVIGLTGGIASGKTTVSRFLREKGGAVIDADELSRQVVEPGQPAWQKIVVTFGSGVLQSDGRLDRPALARIVFADASRRKELEEIVHPEVYTAMVGRLHSCQEQGLAHVVVLDIPLLFESGEALPLCQATVVVWVPQEVQLCRLMARDNLDVETAKRRISAQWPLEKKRLLADFVIDNSGSMQHTAEQVDDLWMQLERMN